MTKAVPAMRRLLYEYYFKNYKPAYVTVNMPA